MTEEAAILMQRPQLRILNAIPGTVKFELDVKRQHTVGTETG